MNWMIQVQDSVMGEEPRNRSEDGREPAGKMLRQDSWSSDNAKADARAVPPPSQLKNQSFSSSSRGRQSGWSKPPSK